MRPKISLLLFVMLFTFALVDFAAAGVTEMKLWTDELMDPDPNQMNPVTGITRYGTLANPATFYIVRWAVNAEGEHNFMRITNDAAAGPYGMAFGMGDIPSNNLWMDCRRTDAAPGWDYPLDCSATERVTFWIKADSGTAPLFFHAESFKPSEPPVIDPNLTQNQKSNVIFVDGETIINIDDFGELYVHRDRHYNGEWQFVSIPWAFLTLKDSAAVDAMIPWSVVWECSYKDSEGDASSFDVSRVRTIKWHTHPENDFLRDKYWASQGNLWGPAGVKAAPGVWAIDEVILTTNAGTGISDVDGNPTVMPLTYELRNAYPNPFNPNTTVEYALPVSNQVLIEVYNTLGQKVRTLVDRYVTAGVYKATWDAIDDNGNLVPAGLYFYKMQASHYNSVKKMILAK